MKPLQYEHIKPLQVILSSEQHKQLKQLALDQDTTVSELIRSMINTSLLKRVV